VVEGAIVRRCGPIVAVCLVALLGAGASEASAATWHVRAGAAAGGTGSATAPFATLEAVEKAAGPGDTIVVDPAPLDTPPLDGGLALKPGQRLVGGGPPVTAPAGLARLPVLTNTTAARLDGDGVRLARDTSVSNLVVRGTYRGAIYGLDSVGVTISGNDVSKHNTSCTKGFLVQPFNVPTGVPFVGGGVAGMGTLAPQNGWAGIMVDGDSATGSIDIHGNVVHDGDCGDGIDIRAAGSSDLTARVEGNLVTRLKQGTFDAAPVGSVLAIGMQARDSARLHVDQDRNTQTSIGSDGADCEGQFANTSESGAIDDTVDHNSFSHGIGGFSCNGFEAIVSNGGGSIDITLRNSSFEDNVGDMFEEGNLGAGSSMRWDMRNVVARRTSERGMNPPTSSDMGANPVPFNLGDCMVLGHNGGGNSTTFLMRDSVLEGCNNGITALSGLEATNGVGIPEGLVVDIARSRIAGNAKYGVHVVNSAPLRRLHVRIAETEITGSGAAGASIEAEPTGTVDDARLDLGGGPFGSTGANCLYGNASGDAEATRVAVSAKANWWGHPGDPAAGQVVAREGGSVASDGGLDARPACGPRAPAPEPAPGAKTPRRLTLSVIPHVVRAGTLRRFRFRVLARGGGARAAAVSRAIVRFAGHKGRTNAHGVATIRARLPRAGRYRASASRSGLGHASALVRARSGARRSATFTG
jgi:hypothetical protein